MDKIFIAYISITALCITLVYLFELLNRLFYRKQETIIEKSLTDCPVCAYRYIIENMQKIHKCPQCGSLNKS